MSEYTFKAKSYKGLVDEVEITSGRGLVVLAGDNKQGKSSFLDGIREAVRYAGTRETPEPIHQGQDEAVVEITDHQRGRIYRRTFRRTKTGRVTSDLAVYATDGAKYSNPAELLAEDVGAEIIDAGEFARMSAREQREVLLRQITLPFDLDEIAAEKAGAEERRREAGREVKRLEGALSSLTAPVSGVPTEEVSAQEILDKLGFVQAENRRREDAERENRFQAQQVQDVEAEIARLQMDLAVKRERKEAAYKARAALGDLVDLAPLQAQLAAVDETNAAVRSAREYSKIQRELGAAQQTHESVQSELDLIEARKREGLAAAAFPDERLSFDDAGVIYDGVPFQQLNDADKRIVGARILVGASDRKLRLGFLREGDLLDDENLERLRAVAVESDYTFIVERGRDASKDIGYVFREGVLDGSAE